MLLENKALVIKFTHTSGNTRPIVLVYNLIEIKSPDDLNLYNFSHNITKVTATKATWKVFYKFA